VRSGYTIKALDESNWDAFAGLVEANHGVFGVAGAWAFTPRRPRASAEPGNAARTVQAGTAHGPWCWMAATGGLVPGRAPDEVPKIKKPGRLREEPHDLAGTGGSPCNFVGKGTGAKRRHGGAPWGLDLIARLGGGKVEGYPEAAGSVAAGFLFNGALSNLREARVRPRPQDRQAPLGRHQGRRANHVGAQRSFRNAGPVERPVCRAGP